MSGTRLFVRCTRTTETGSTPTSSPGRATGRLHWTCSKKYSCVRGGGCPSSSGMGPTPALLALCGRAQPLH